MIRRDPHVGGYIEREFVALPEAWKALQLDPNWVKLQRDLKKDVEDLEKLKASRKPKDKADD
jgi:hypothetical protein